MGVDFRSRWLLLLWGWRAPHFHAVDWARGRGSSIRVALVFVSHAMTCYDAATPRLASHSWGSLRLPNVRIQVLLCDVALV